MKEIVYVLEYYVGSQKRARMGIVISHKKMIGTRKDVLKFLDDEGSGSVFTRYNDQGDANYFDMAGIEAVAIPDFRKRIPVKKPGIRLEGIRKPTLEALARSFKLPYDEAQVIEEVL